MGASVFSIYPVKYRTPLGQTRPLLRKGDSCQEKAADFLAGTCSDLPEGERGKELVPPNAPIAIAISRAPAPAKRSGSPTRPRFLLPQNPDDLFFREPARLHVHPPPR
jgi:hypothetical protein